MTFLPPDVRAQYRNALKSIDDDLLRIRKHLKEGIRFSPDDCKRFHAMSDTMDPAGWMAALEHHRQLIDEDFDERLRVSAVIDLSSFAEYMNRHEPPASKLHLFICDRMMSVERGDVARLMLSMPPGHAKSTYGSRLFPAWWLGRHPTKQYLQAGHSQKFVENQFGKKVRAMIDSERYGKVFPDVGLADDSQAADYFKIAGHGGDYTTKGVGQGISGVRASMANIDDPYANKKDAHSATIREGVRDWFTTDFGLRLLPDAGMFLIMTRWHLEDLGADIHSFNLDGEAEHWEVINLPALCEDETVDPLGRSTGAALWPEFWTYEKLKKIKATLPASDWEALYQSNPVPPGGAMILREWTRNRYEGELSPHGHPQGMFNGEKPEGPVPLIPWRRIIVSTDTASKTGERNDWTVAAVFYESIEGAYALAEIVRFKKEFPEMVARVEATAKRHRASALLIEDKASGTQFIQTRKQQAEIPIHPIKVSNESKEFRVDGVLPIIAAGSLWLPKTATWLTAYESELFAFPSVTHDDQVDATSQALAWLRDTGTTTGGTKKIAGVGRGTTPGGTPFQRDAEGRLVTDAFGNQIAAPAHTARIGG